MSFCRITGRSRGLPKPNYFPLLAPISPADAKRCCRITGKSYGLPSHHYIPVLLTSSSGRTKCKITNVSGELGPHHFTPELYYGNRKHEVLPDYRYIFPVLDGSTEAQKALIEMLLGKQVTEDKRYVYTVQERRCSLVFTAQMEAAVRDGDVRDVMLAKDSDTVLIKMKQGRSVSMDFKDFTDDVEMFEGEGPNTEVLRQREMEEMEERKKKRKRSTGLSSMKKIFENKEKLAEVEELEEEKLRLERITKKAKLDIKHEKHDLKTYSASNFDLNHMRSKSSVTMCSGEWRDQMHPLIESWDWEAFEKEINSDNVIPKVSKLPSPVKLLPYHCNAEILEVDHNISQSSVSLESVPCVNPLKPIKSKPSEAVIHAIKDLSEERLSETSNVNEKLYDSNKIDMLPALDSIVDLVKNIKKGKREKVAKVSGLTLDINKAKKFIPGQHVNTPQGPIFVPGQTLETPDGPIFVPGLTVNTPTGPGLIPGHIVTNEQTEEPFFLAGQILKTGNGEKFVCGQTIKSKDESYKFVEGQTVISEDGLKFVPGKIVTTPTEQVFVPGQTMITPEGVQFIPGQTIIEDSGMIFTPGQNAKINNEWQFVPGQIVNHNEELEFVPGATLSTPNGLKFVPGQVVSIENGDSSFVPGVSRVNNKNILEFVPGATVETIDGPKFVEGQIVKTETGEKFMPGKSTINTNGHVEFSIAKSIDNITFTESTTTGLPIDIKSCSISEESLYVFGHMVQTEKAIEFYPGPKTPTISGKVVPGRLVKNDLNESRFVPGMMIEGIFVPGQIVFTENGEQFVPGQVIDTVDGPKFVPGQVVNTKSGPKFVPGQTVHTIDGPRFVPGQIIETKAGPTFIPGQVISTEDEGSRFVPGQVVDTEEGPRFVPGRVIETDDNCVTFVPGQIVQTPEGLKFVAPDLTEGEEGLEFSVQSFVVTPEELRLLKVKTNPNDTTSTKGELTIDTNMLKQLSAAGMSIGRQVPAELPAINVILNHTKNSEALKAFVSDFGLKDEVANQLMDVITSIIEMSAHLKSSITENDKSGTSSADAINKKSKSKKRMEAKDMPGCTGGNGQSGHTERVKNSIAAAVLAALVTAEQFEEVNNNNGKHKYQLILQSIDTILGKSIDEDLVSAMFKVLQTEEIKENICEEILENSSQPKMELIKLALHSTNHKYSISDAEVIEKFGDFLASENEVLGPAFKNISKSDGNLLQHVLGHISESISFIKSDHEAAETLQKAIVAAVQESSNKELELILQSENNKDLKELLVQSIGLAKVLGLTDVVHNLVSVLNDEQSLSKLSNDRTSMNILKRLTVMRKLADKTPSLHSALRKLETDPELARTDPKLRDLVRESAVLMIVPEEPPLMTSEDVPLNLLHPENSLAMEDFLLQRKRHSGALLIMKKGLQAVVPREASRAVLTGQIAYTVLDENGIRHFEPLHVFSALNLSQPTAHRFSMYSCPIADDNADDLHSYSGYPNISSNQRVTRFGCGWSRRVSGVTFDRDSTYNRVSVDNTPSYRGYTSRSLSRSRSTCSRSPPKVEDVLVAGADYKAAGDDEVSLRAGDIVEVLDTKSSLGSKKPRLDPDLDVEGAQLLDTSAAKHKIAVRPKKNHPKGKTTAKAGAGGERWLVRVLEDVAGGEMKTRQGYVPGSVLQEKQAPERDQTALAARRQAVVRELIETEEEFGRDMQQVVSRYMKPMDKAATPKSVFDNRELLFSNFKQICEFHNTVLLEGIKYYASEPRMLGRALLRMEREFDKHAAYCRDEPAAQALLAADPHVRKYFQDLADKLGDDKGITEHLKLPIQRINDYQLLLKELVKYSRRLGDDCADLQKALELFLGVPSRATDNKFLASIEGYRGNIYKLGRLITHDWFSVADPSSGSSKDRYLFLFKARVLVCKLKRIADDRSVFVLKDIVKLPEVEVRDTPDSLEFELRAKTGSTLTVTAHKQSVKEHWLSEIQKNIADVVALAEHAADDLQVVSPLQATPEPPEEKKKKRERQEETKTEAQVQEKRTKVEATEKQTESVSQSVSSKTEIKQVTSSKVETSVEQKVQEKRKVEEVTEQSVTVQEKRSKKEETVAQETQETVVQESSSTSRKQSLDSEKISTREESIRELIAKRKASLEIEAAQKLLKSEVTESSSEVKTEVTSDLAAKSAVTVKDSQQTKSSEQSELKSYVSASVEEKTQTVKSVEEKTETVKSGEEKPETVKSGEDKTETVNSGDGKGERVESGEVKEEVKDSCQAATEGDDMSRYSRTSRLSGEYSSSSRRLSGNRYDSTDGAALTSSYSRRESGSRLESSRLESSSALESGTTARYESKYSSSSALESGSKYGIESSFQSKTESSKYVDGEATSKIDSIASKYGIGLNSDTAVEARSSKYAIESSYDSSNIGGAKVESSFESKTESKYLADSETASKIDSIASKYGRKLSSTGSVESSKVESTYESIKNGGSSIESKSYSKMANGSISTGVATAREAALYPSASRDGRPAFSCTLEGQSIEPGENAIFSCALESAFSSSRLTWLKNNKPLTDRLMDRCSISSTGDGGHKLELKHCREDDSGLYTARAENEKGNAHCSAQLVVHELTAEERQERNALKKPYFVVALKDTEVMENTYLRFMVKVKGDPNPEVKFYRGDREITSSCERVSITRRLADRGCYELVIADVAPGDAGVYSARALNEFGDCSSEARVTVVDDKNIFGELPPGGEGLLAKGEKASFTWKRDGEPFDPEERFKVLLGDDEDSLALVFQHVRPEDAGLYTCVAKTSTGNISCSAELTVQGAVHELRREPEKPTLVIEHRSAAASAGASAMLEMKCRGFPKPSVEFKHDGEVVQADARHKFLYEDEESMSLVIKNVTSSDAGTYHVTARNDLGEDSTTMTLVVNAPPKITKKIENQSCMVGSTQTVTIEIEGSPAPEVTFYKDGVELKSSDRIQIVKESETIYKIVMKEAKLTDTGSYSVVAKNEINQCSDFWQWQVSSPPKLLKKMGETKVCELKETVSFKIETQAEPAPTVKWFKDKTELTESSSIKISSTGESHTLVISSAERSDAGEYSCEVRNGHGAAADACALRVRAAPRFTRALQDAAASEGEQRVEFTVQVEAYPEPSVKWYHGDVEITEKKSVFTRVDSGGTHKLILKEVSAEMSGQFTCKVANELGQDQCHANFTVNRKPRILKSLVDMTVDAGQTLKLEVEVEGCPAPTLTWRKDGKEVTTDARVKIERDTQRLENYHLTVTLVKEEDGGEYEVTASNEMGSVSCKSTVTVHTREVSSRFTKESVTEHEIEDDTKTKKKLVEDEVDSAEKQAAKKGKTESETGEEKSFWDDIEEEQVKNVAVHEVQGKVALKAQKSVTEPEKAETKSFWDDSEEDAYKKSKVQEVEKPRSATKSISEPEEAETKSIWDDAADGKNKKLTIDEVDTKPAYTAQTSVSEPEQAETKSIWDDVDDDGIKKPKVEDIEKPRRGTKSISEPEEAEKKSIWDENEEEKNKKVTIEEVEDKPSYRAQKSVTEPEQSEMKSIWDDVDDDGKTKKTKVEDVKKKSSEKAKFTVTEPEEAEEKSIWDENHNEKSKKPIIEEIEEVEVKLAKKSATKAETIEEVAVDNNLKSLKRKSIRQESIPEEPLSAETEGRVFETVTTFKKGDNGAIVVSKVSSSRSHGAIITGPAETHTIHKMTSTAVHYDDDEDDAYNIGRVIRPNVPHKTSLQVEEIASHSYYLSEMGVYMAPEHVRRGTYGIIEEPQTDSDAEQSSRRGRHGARTISILSLSDEDSWRNDSLSREISIEDLSKSIFDIDETRKVFSKDSYKRHSSFIEDFFTDEGEEESVILREKSEKVFENDITEKLIHISKEFDDNEYRTIEHKIDDVKNRIIEELVQTPEKVFDNITKNISETSFERKKKFGVKLHSLEEEHDDEVEELLRRSHRQRTLLDQIINHEDEQAPPTISSSSMKDGHIYESLPLVYSVSASGHPAPKVRWLHNGKEVRQNARISISKSGDLHKLEIEAVDMDDGGKWECEVSNELGKKVQAAELSVTSVNEFRKPIFTQPLESQQALQREPVTLKAVCTADPLPHVAWLVNGQEVSPDATLVADVQTKNIEHGLKECTFTLTIPTGRHSDTGTYTLKASNQYGVGESSARLDILLRPEIAPLKDVTAAPYEETQFIACVKANPIAEVQWSKDGLVIKPSEHHDIKSSPEAETYELVIKELGLDDAGVYKVSAKNDLGETSQQARLTVHTAAPTFTKPLAKQTFSDYEAAVLQVRCDGVPNPEVHWYRDDEEVASDERRQVSTKFEGQTESRLEIQHFSQEDAGQYRVRAVNLAGEASCSAAVSLARAAPGFALRLERQRDVDEGEPLLLKAKVQGSPMPKVAWYKDGVQLSPSDEHVEQSALPDGCVKLAIAAVTPADCGAYKLVLSNPHGDASAQCAVAVNPTPRKPSFSQELEDTRAVVGQPLKLQVQVMAFPAPEVKWFKDGQPIRPSQAINFVNQPGGVVGLVVDACRPEDAGVYTVTLHNKLGDIASKAKVEVAARDRKPAFVSELSPTKVIEGFPVRLQVKVLAHPTASVKWLHNGKELTSSERVRTAAQPDGTHVLTIDAAAPADAGVYSAVAANDQGEATTEAELTVVDRTDDSSPQERPQFSHGLRDATVDEGAPLDLSVPFVGNPVPSPSWTKDGQPLKPSDRILLTCEGNRLGLEINPAEPADAGVYGVRIVNPLGEDSTKGTVTVRKVYQPPKFLQRFSDLQQLPTFDAKFPARLSGIPAPEIAWYKDGVPLTPSDKYHMKRDGDTCCLYVRNPDKSDGGRYRCVAKNREGQDECEATLQLVDNIEKRQKMEPPSFLKKIGDVEVLRGMSAKFTACVAGEPQPEVEWYRNDERLYPCERIRMDAESTGLLRLVISGVDQSDVATYKCRVHNPHGQAECCASLTYDSLEPQPNKRPLAEQYSDFDKMKKTGVPMPLGDKPIISRMADRHLTLSWRPSIPHAARAPVTYQVEMCEVPDGDWFTARAGLRSCVCDIRNLQPFQDYKFRIRVENKHGVSDPSPYALTHRCKLEPEPPKFVPYLAPGIDFRPDTSPYFPKDFDIERPPHDQHAAAPRFLRQEHECQYGVKGHSASLFWFVYGYPKPRVAYYFEGAPVQCGGRYDVSYTRNGQATLFINKMLERDEGYYEAVATNEHGEARQRVRLLTAEYPAFIRRPDETVAMQRKAARLDARITGVPYPDIKWYKDWQPIAASSRIKIQFIEPDTTVLIIQDAILKDAGLYSVSARNVAGSVSSSAMLHVEEDEEEYCYRIREHPPRVKPSSKPLGDFFDLGDELGRGVQGVVYHAAERLTGRNYAVKIMHGNSALKPFMKNELDIMNLLNSRGCTRLHAAFEQPHTVALVTELGGGGGLLRDRLLRQPGYSEREVAGYVRQLLRALKDMHDNSVAHLGLTIGELILSHAGSDELKLCDFGLSRRVQFGQHASLDYGMPEFVAPEVASGEGVSFPADLWSVGIITYILLSGISPFRGSNDRETLTKIREGKWVWHDEQYWSHFSAECRDFISRLLVHKWTERMDVDAALKHPWLLRADRLYHDEYVITTDRLRNYYNLYKDWTGNAACRTWFRRRPLSSAFEHPSRMVYPPGLDYTPDATPEPEGDRSARAPGAWDLKFKQWEHPDWEVSATSESHYQNGPDTYLLQLRDTGFPVRLREYMKVACHRHPGYSLAVHDTYDPRTPIIRERRRFTDVMDEEIDDERRERINQYGADNASYVTRRLRHELGTRLDSYAEMDALMEAKRDGQAPFFREKPPPLAVREGDSATLSCYAVGDPKPVIQWFKNDMVLAEGSRIKIIEDGAGRSTLKLEPAMHHDVGYYKVVARNKVGQTVARTRIVEATTPDAPDSPQATDVSDTEVLLRWKQPRHDGNAAVLCYSLQYKKGDAVEWRDVAANIDHEFFVVRSLDPDTSYQFRLSARNKIGWSDKGIPTQLVKTKAAGAAKVEVTKAMAHLQQLTEAGREIVEEQRPELDYSVENNPLEWDTSDKLAERYSFISEIHRGRFCSIVKGVDRTTDSVVVAKLLDLTPETEVQVTREFEALRRLRHERIPCLLAAYQAPGASTAALILEKLQGADVLTYLSSRHSYSEQLVASIVCQVLDALQYLHWRGYCHLDVQPDNIVLEDARSPRVKLVDLGHAHKVTKLGTSVPQVGDLEYKAPEIINDEPAFPQTDVWSLGVVAYVLLSGVSPFRGADDQETKLNISYVRYRFEHLYKELTQEATRFLMFIFKKVPLKRPTAEECHEHRWLNHSDFMNRKRERAVFLGHRLKEFADEYHARKSAAAERNARAGAGRALARSNSIQEELSTTFASQA